MDINKALEMIEKRKQAQRLYYIRKRGLSETDEETKIMEKAKKQMMSYEKQKERQRQQRAERGLKNKGRPFKTPEERAKRENIMEQVGEISKLNLLDRLD